VNRYTPAPAFRVASRFLSPSVALLRQGEGMAPDGWTDRFRRTGIQSHSRGIAAAHR